MKEKLRALWDKYVTRETITYVIFGSSGLIGRFFNQTLGKKINFLGVPGVFRWMIVGQNIWKETGWGTIIFLAALIFWPNIRRSMTLPSN